MKKILCALAVSISIFSGLFAEGGLGGFIENHKCERPIRIEADIGLIPGGTAAEVRCAYMFRLNDIFRWDVGAGLDYVGGVAEPGFFPESNQTFGGGSINIITFGSLWAWDLYGSWGIGLGFNTLGGVGFIPADVRLGWQPGSRKNKRWQLKLELASMGSTKALVTFRGAYNNSEYDVTKIVNAAAPRFIIGAAVRF